MVRNYINICKKNHLFKGCISTYRSALFIFLDLECRVSIAAHVLFAENSCCSNDFYTNQHINQLLQMIALYMYHNNIATEYIFVKHNNYVAYTLTFPIFLT